MTNFALAFDELVACDLKFYRLSVRSRNETVLNMSCMFVEWQAPLMAKWKPAAWLPLIRNLHSKKQQWLIKAAPEASFVGIRAAIASLSDRTQKNTGIGKSDQFRMGRINERDKTLQMLVFTGAKWMDAVDVMSLTPDGANNTRVDLFSTSTGLVPLCIPFAAALNILFFWVPFHDMGKNAEWLSTLRKAAQERGLEIDVVKSDR